MLNLFQIELPLEDEDFLINRRELTTFAQPVLPIIKKALNMSTPNSFLLFDGCNGTKIISIDVYDYYYIRLSTSNLDHFLALR